MVYLKLNFNTEPKKSRIKSDNKHLNRLIMNASNKRRIDEKNAAFIRGRPLIIFYLSLRRRYSRAALIRVTTVSAVKFYKYLKT